MQSLKVIENDIVPVYQTEKGIKVVNGRELHAVLESKQDFSTWVKRRLLECDAEANKDFDTAPQIYGTANNGYATRLEYIIKLDTAKEMAMLERNEKGKQVRRYFIEVEKRYKRTSIELNTMSPELQAIIMHDHKIQQVESKVDHVSQELQDFKQDLPILGIEIDRITAAAKKKGVHCLGGKDSSAYHDKSLRTKVYSDIYRELKRQFGVTTYKAIKRSQCEKAIGIIDAYELPYVLLEQVQDSNAQMKMEVM